MKKGIWIVCICTVLLLLAALFVWANRAEEGQSEETIVRELVNGYRSNPTLSGENSGLLEELAKISPEKAAQWAEIMDVWASADSGMEVSENVLPDGLVEGDALCIVVLGYQLNADGSMRDELIGRLRVARESAKKYPNAYILCTGGGTASSSSATEAEAMADWLIQNGVSDQRVLIEANSLTTTENAIFCSRLLREQYPEVSQVALVSSDYHLPWAAVLFQTEFILGGQGITLVSNAAYPTTTSLSGSSLLRYQASGILEIAQEHWKVE